MTAQPGPGSVVGVLGVGRLGETVARFLGHRHPDLPLLLGERSPERVARLRAELPRARVASPAEMAAEVDILIVCLAASVARQLLPGLAFRAGQHVVSAMASIRLAELASLVGPAPTCSRALLLPRIAQDRQVIPVLPETDATRLLLGGHHQLLPLAEERDLHALWTVTCVLGVIARQGVEMVEWLDRHGIAPATGEPYVRGMFEEVLGLMHPGPAAARQELSTPGGFNEIVGRNLEAAGAFAAFAHNLDLVLERLDSGR